MEDEERRQRDEDLLRAEAVRGEKRHYRVTPNLEVLSRAVFVRRPAMIPMGVEISLQLEGHVVDAKNGRVALYGAGKPTDELEFIDFWDAMKALGKIPEDEDPFTSGHNYYVF